MYPVRLSLSDKIWYCPFIQNKPRLLFMKMFENEVDYNLSSIERISIRKNKMICTFEGLGNLIFWSQL